MLQLNLSKSQQWLDLGHGVSLLVEPLTTAVMLAERVNDFEALAFGI